MKSILKKILFFLFFLLKRRKRKPVSINRIAIIAAGYLGDTFWALQTVPLLNRIYPGAEITVIGRKFCPAISPGSAKFFLTDDIPSDRHRDCWSFRGMMRDARLIRKNSMPDLIFDLTGNRYSALFARKIGAYTVGMDLAGEATALYHFCARISNRKCHHLAMQPIAAVCSFSDLPEPENVPDLLLPEPGYNAQTVFQKLDLATDIRPVLIVPGAGWHAKMWSPERFRAVIRYCIDHGKTVLLSAGNETETALCKTLISGLKTDLIRILSDDLPLLVSTFPFLDFCIGNDSGISHLSAAAGVKTIQLFCPTNPVHSKALGKCVTVLRSSCLLKPEGLCKFCTGELNCSRPEQMDISPEKVIAEMERMQHEDRP